VVDTNNTNTNTNATSSGMLAPLEDMILVGIIEKIKKGSWFG
jgi:hypothetical protein